jgi:hypothetical protein
MAVSTKTIVTFIASGNAGSVSSIATAGPNPLLSGDPIIEVVDLTAGGPVTQFFGTVVVSSQSNQAFIVEILANAGMAGHSCLALIGSR